MVDIAADVQALSHKLHSSHLDYLGVGCAIRSSVTSSRSNIM